MKDQTIAQFLKITKFPFKIKDDNGNETYHENSSGYWIKREYDSSGNEIYFEDSNGYWSKRGYDSAGNETYFETSNGIITDNRPKTTISWEEISEKFGIDPDKMKIEKKGS